jgi:hypothetical protein
MARFEAVDAAQGGRDADGAAAVGAEGNRDETAGDGVGGATGGAAGVVGWVVRVEGRAGVGVVVCGVCGREVRAFMVVEWYGGWKGGSAGVSMVGVGATYQDQSHAYSFSL